MKIEIGKIIKNALTREPATIQAFRGEYPSVGRVVKDTHPRNARSYNRHVSQVVEG